MRPWNSNGHPIFLFRQPLKQSLDCGFFYSRGYITINNFQLMQIMKCMHKQDTRTWIISNSNAPVQLQIQAYLYNFRRCEFILDGQHWLGFDISIQELQGLLCVCCGQTPMFVECGPVDLYNLVETWTMFFYCGSPNQERGRPFLFKGLIIGKFDIFLRT
jgi:hypothetical protein